MERRGRADVCGPVTLREIEERRLAALRDLYAQDEFGGLPESVERLELHVEQVLRGEQPTWPAEDGLPFTPDPALEYRLPEPGGLPFPARRRKVEATNGVQFVTAAYSFDTEDWEERVREVLMESANLS